MHDAAPDGIDLERGVLPSVLEKLEEWGQELKHSPEVIHRLGELGSAADVGDTASALQTVQPVPPRGPKLPGPTP